MEINPAKNGTTAHPRHNPLYNESGVALGMILILSAISLAFMSALIYMTTTATQMSGGQKRFKTALEAAHGGVDFTFQVISERGDPFISDIVTYDILADDVGGEDCLSDKLNSDTSVWAAACDSTLSIIPGTSSTFDWRVDLGADPVYRAYAKIVDTVDGNSGGTAGLTKGGVVSSNSGEITPLSVPYLYSIEVDAQNPNDPLERAKVSVLYQY